MISNRSAVSQGTVFRRLAIAVLTVALVASLGCDRVDPGADPALHLGGIERGEQALERKDFVVAEQEFDGVLQAGVKLSADRLGSLITKRTLARIGQNKLDEAEADIEIMESGGGAMDEVWLLKGHLALKRGETAKAKAAFAAAKKLNPDLKTP
ncbi:MAG TPA: hypothetical protein VGE52_03590 [Pirellulales bacterium]